MHLLRIVGSLLAAVWSLWACRKPEVAVPLVGAMLPPNAALGWRRDRQLWFLFWVLFVQMLTAWVQCRESASWTTELFEPLETGKGLIIWVCYYITSGNSFFFFFLPSGSTLLCLLKAVKYDKVTHPALVTMSTNKFGVYMHCHSLIGSSLQQKHGMRFLPSKPHSESDVGLHCTLLGSDFKNARTHEFPAYLHSKQD